MRNARLFVDFSSSTNSGIALVNPGTTPIVITATLKRQNGADAGSAQFSLGGKNQTATFVDQLVTGLPPSFLGTLTLSGSGQFAAINLSSATNRYGEIVYSALPVADLDNLPSATTTIFPQVVEGGGIATQILLMNPSATTTSTGTLAFYDQSGLAQALDFGVGIGLQSTLNYSIPPNAMVKYATKSSGTQNVGYAVLTRESGLLPIGSGIFSILSGGLISQAAVPGSPQTTSSRMFVEVSSTPLSRNTGLAIVNRNSAAASITLSLTTTAGIQYSGTLRLGANSHTARFITDIISRLPRDFEGVLTLTSDLAISPLTLRLTTNQRGDAIYSTLPIADLNNLPTGPLFIPQIADGAGYQTQVILLNPGSTTGTLHLDFFDRAGNKVIFK